MLMTHRVCVLVFARIAQVILFFGFAARDSNFANLTRPEANDSRTFCRFEITASFVWAQFFQGEFIQTAAFVILAFEGQTFDNAHDCLIGINENSAIVAIRACCRLILLEPILHTLGTKKCIVAVVALKRAFILCDKGVAYPTSKLIFKFLAQITHRQFSFHISYKLITIVKRF